MGGTYLIVPLCVEMRGRNKYVSRGRVTEDTWDGWNAASGVLRRIYFLLRYFKHSIVCPVCLLIQPELLSPEFAIWIQSNFTFYLWCGAIVNILCLVPKWLGGTSLFLCQWEALSSAVSFTSVYVLFIYLYFHFMHTVFIISILLAKVRLTKDLVPKAPLLFLHIEGVGLCGSLICGTCGYGRLPLEKAQLWREKHHA